MRLYQRKTFICFPLDIFSRFKFIPFSVRSIPFSVPRFSNTLVDMTLEHGEEMSILQLGLCLSYMSDAF